jgi:FkbM family methyltransferase
MQKSLLLAKSLRKLRILQGRLLAAFNFTLRQKLLKTTYKIPIIKNIGWSNIFENEPWMTEILEVLLPVYKGVFIDVGVNIGQTLLKLKSIDHGREYFGFEVNPSCIAYLKDLVKDNNLPDVNLMPFGLSDKTGLTRLQFYYNNDVDVTASIIPDYRPGDKVVKSEYVISSRLDDLEVFSQKKTGIIKIDVEGAELEVISGAKKTISDDRPVLIIEILPAYSEENIFRIKRQTQIESIFKELKYNLFRINKDSGNHFKGLIRLGSFKVDGNISQSDFLLIPEEKNYLVSQLMSV